MCLNLICRKVRWRRSLVVVLFYLGLLILPAFYIFLFYIIFLFVCVCVYFKIILHHLGSNPMHMLLFAKSVLE